MYVSLRERMESGTSMVLIRIFLDQYQEVEVNISVCLYGSI